MGIFDIFKKKEEYNGVTLNENVDVELQKRLIDLGQQDKISSLDYKTVQKESQPKSVMERIVSDKPQIIDDGATAEQKPQNNDFIDKANKAMNVASYLYDTAMSLDKTSPYAIRKYSKEVAKFFTLGAEDYMAARKYKKEQNNEAQQVILDATFNTPIGKKITGFVSETTSDLPIKMTAAIDPILPLDSGVKDLPYDQRLQAYRDAFRNSQFSNNAAIRIADIAMNSGVQSAIGVMLNFVPYAGRALSTGYWASISAEEQRENKGDVYSLGNIAIDTIGDSILGNMIGKMFGTKQTVSKFASAFKGFFVEGGTEVAQTILKNGNDFIHAKTNKEKNEIIEKTKNYITSGDILIELAGSGLSGAGIASVAGVAGSNPDATDINLINNSKNPLAPVPQIYNEVVDEAKMEVGQEPDIYKQAVAEAKTTVVPSTEQAPESIYHMTNADTENIKDTKFIMGLNSAFGEAAFFAPEANKLYGENQLEVKPSDFNLKTIDTVQEQMDFIEEYKAKNLADAIRKEGEYDGFIIPQPNRANDVFGITNQEKLNSVLKAQQFITTDEALSMRKDFKFLEDLDIPIVAKNKLMTPSGEQAYGKYSAGMISFLANPHKTTIPHETTHAFVDLMLDAKQKQDILNEVKRRYAGKVKQMMERRNMKEDAAAEEVLADDFAKYYLEKKTKGSSQKSSSKLRQFYDWFVEQMQRLFNTGDKINRLYKDIETKKPSVAQRKRAIKKLTMTLDNLNKLQQEYFQDPEKLTTKFLEHSELKNREFASYQFLKNLLSSKSLPLKEVERVLISDVLETQFKDEKKINLNDFKNAVIGELMPLSIIESDTYADYGSSNVGMESDASKTYIFNSPFSHGYTGHFSGDFQKIININDIEVKQIPTTKQWAVVNKNQDLTEENIAENVYHVAQSKADAEAWAAKRVRSGGQEFDAGKSGLFPHVRTFDNIEDNVAHIAEIQSDSFQNLDRTLEKDEYTDADLKRNKQRIENTERLLKAAEEKEDLIDISNKKQFLKTLIAEKKKIEDFLSNPTINETKERTQFLQYKNIWHERTIREIIRQKAIEGFEVLRFPTPRTVSLIEGYTSEDGTGQIPPNTAIGDRFDYGGEDYIVLAQDEQMGEEVARVAPVSDLRGIFDYDTARQEDVDNRLSEMIYELENSDAEEIDIYELKDDFTNEQLLEMRDSLINGNRSIIEEKLLPFAEKVTDQNYTSSEEYAMYYNEGSGYDSIFSMGDDQLIILDRSDNVETMSFGKEAKDADEFSIDDFDGAEKTVLNFYDKQVNRYLAKIRKGNWDLITDANGNQWYETKIMPEDKAAVEAFQTKDNIDRPKIYTGTEVANIVNEIEKSKADLSEEELEEYGDDFELSDYLRKIIEDQDFTLKPVKIMNLIQADKDLKDYIERNEQRYPEGADGLDNPIVVGNWRDGSFGVLDGYNRILTKFNEGQQFIDAYVSNDVFELVDEDRKMLEKFIDYVRLREPENVGLEIEARRFAEATGLDPDLSNLRLANKFDELLSAMPKYQAMEPSKRSDLEYRRNQAIEEKQVKDFEEADRILQARETNLFFNSAEKEAGYKNFKKLVARRKWILDEDTDDAKLKEKMPTVNIDDDLFSGATDMSNNELLENFKERYAEEQALAEIATQKTSQELANIKKLEAQRAVRRELTGRNIALKTAINVVQGKEAPIIITKKASVLLKNRLRDMARAAKTGANFGRQEMRSTLNEAFSTKLSNLKTMKKAVATYADALPIGERGKMLKMVANLSTQGQLVKAYARIDAALEAVDNKNELEQIKYRAKKLKKAMKSGSGVAVDYQKKMAEILNDYDLSKPTQRTLDRLKSLSEFLKNNPDLELQDHIIKRLDRLNKKPLADFKTEEIKDLNDLLGRLWALGELKYRLNKKSNERVIQEAVNRVLSTTVSTDNKNLSLLSFLHAPRVADAFDGYRQYKGENVKLQRKLSDAVSAASITSKNIVEDVAEITSIIKNKFSKEEQAIMAFNLMKDQGQYDQAQAIISAYTDEFGWKSEDDLTPTIEMENVMDILRGVFNKNIDHLAAVYEEIENKPFIKVEKYFPIKYDKEFDKTIDIEAPTVNQMAQFMTKQVQKGFTIARVKGVKKVPRIDVFNIFAEAISEQQYYMRVQPAINEVSAIVSDSKYQQALGEVGSRWWDKYLKAVASKGKSFNNGIYDNVLRKFKLNISNAMLGFKVTSALIQPTAIIDAYAYVYLSEGALAANTLLINLAGTIFIPSYAKSIVKKSVGLQLRTAGELTLREMEESPSGSKIGRAWQKGGMWALKKMDLLTASAVNQTMYKHYKRKGMSEEEAHKEADFVTALTQGSSEIADLPLILQTGELAKTLLTFQTFNMNRWGIISHDIGRSAIINGSIPRKFKGLIALFILSLAGGLENILRKKTNEKIKGKTYPDKFTFMQQTLLTTPESIPIIGNILTSVIEFNSGMSIPLARVFEDFIRGSKDLINPSGETKSKREENRKKGAIKAAEAIMSVKGVSGASQLSDIIERVLIPPQDAAQIVGSSSSGMPRPSLPKPPIRQSRPSMPRPR